MGYSWVYHYEPDSKRQSVEWKITDSLAQKKFCVQCSVKKVMLTEFWDMKGRIIIDFHKNGEIVNVASNCQLL